MHKLIENGLPPFCPILPATGTSSYKLAKVLLPFMASLTSLRLFTKVAGERPRKINYLLSTLHLQKQPLEVFYKNRCSQNRPATSSKNRLWHRCFPANFARFLRTPFLQNISERVLQNLQRILN